MRRSFGKQQAMTLRTLIRRYTQGAAELAREPGGEDAFQEVGGMDDAGNWRAAGISNITSTADPFYSGG